MFNLTNLCKDKAVWITSDFHFFHRNLCRGTSVWIDRSGCRDFDTIEQMNDTILNNINTVVKPDDVLIHLGDFAFGGRDNVISARKNIKCINLIHINGNHDIAISKDSELQKLFTWVGDYTELKYEHLFFCLFHYPLATWNGKNYGCIMIHGHCHTTVNKFNNGRIMDVALESNNMKPYNMSEIVKIMNNTPILKDHHI